MKRAAIVLTTGFEEIEAIAPMDILRRAGVEVDIVGVDAKVATGSHNLTISTDKELVEVMNELYDVLILPGGMPGAKIIKRSPRCTRVCKNVIMMQVNWLQLIVLHRLPLKILER